MPAPRQAPLPRTRRRPPLRLLLAGLAVVAVLAGLAWVVLVSGLLAVRTLVVEGTRTVAPDQVRARVGPVEGVPLARLDAGALEAAVETLPKVADTRVERRWPKTLAVVVTERVPLAVRAEGSGYLVLDREAVVLETVARRPEGLPSVAVEATDPALPGALEVLAALPPALAARVESVTAGSRDGVRLRLGRSREVAWGDASASAQKAAVLEVLLAREPGAAVYDVSAPDAPTTQR